MTSRESAVRIAWEPLRAALALDLEDVAADRSVRLSLHRVPSF